MPKRQESSSQSNEDESSQSEDTKFVYVQVSRLTPNVSDKHLQEIFSHFGNVISVTLTKGPRLTSSARIQFEKKMEAGSAITFMNNGYIDGSKICVESEIETRAEKQPARKTSSERPIRKQGNKQSEKDRRNTKNRNSRDRRYRDRSRSRDRRNRNRKARSSSSSSAVSSSSRSDSDRRSSNS